MSSLMYLFLTGIKNSFFEVLRKPAKLIMYLFIIGMIIFIVAVSMFTKQEGGSRLDLIWLDGIIFLLILMFVFLSIQKGLSNGDIIFDMSDVNLLFVSPVSPKSILIYGIVRMVKMVFLAGFFILFQSNTLSDGFGVGFGAVLLILLGFILTVTLLSILSLVIYSATNGKPKRKRIVKVLTAAVFAPLIVYAVSQYIATGDYISALANTIRSPVFAWTPVAGWAAHGTISLISGNLLTGLFFYVLLICTGVLLVLYIIFGKADYYEDVLVASETAFERKRAIADGQINSAAESGRHVKVAKTGIGGFGAKAVFYKHIRESFRANRFGLLTLPSLFTVLGAILMSVFLKTGSGIVTILSILMWTQIFLIGTGRGLKELYSHYIYMIPESSFSKIIWSNLEVVLKVFLESILTFVISGIILCEHPLVIFAAILVYTLFSLLLIGINYVSMRWTTADISRGLLIMLYYIAVIIVMLPGLAAAMITGFSVGGMKGMVLGLAILAVWELIASFICFALSKGMLDRCDMPVVGAKK